MSIEIEPSTQLSFRRPLTQPSKEILIIRNPTQLPIAFKVKTTAPKQYCVRPNSGRVEPGQELEVQVQMQAMKDEPPMDFKCKDKFLVQSVAITAERDQLPQQDLWPTVERDAKDQIKEKKIRCAFLAPAGHDITQIQEENEPPSSHSTLSSHTIQAPASPVFIAAETLTKSSSSEVAALKRELEQAQETIRSLQSTIEKVQSEATILRQRKPEPASSSAPVMTAVHLKPQDGYPASYVAGAAAAAFIFAYLFF
ncbi:phosphatidylinositol-binding protein scs2 [Mortierella sp. NVP85]|nr:phosphatidylinositol-binding protein scs2 [Mortierella sp. NVP85]